MTDAKAKKCLSTLGLCARAGKLAMGTPQVCEVLRSRPGQIVLVLEAADTSENTHKRLTDRCAYYNTELVRLPCAADDLGRAVGKTHPVAAVGVTDAQLVRALRPHLPDTVREQNQDSIDPNKQ